MLDKPKVGKKTRWHMRIMISRTHVPSVENYFSELGLVWVWHVTRVNGLRHTSMRVGVQFPFHNLESLIRTKLRREWASERANWDIKSFMGIMHKSGQLSFSCCQRRATSRPRCVFKKNIKFAANITACSLLGQITDGVNLYVNICVEYAGNELKTAFSHQKPLSRLAAC